MHAVGPSDLMGTMSASTSAATDVSPHPSQPPNLTRAEAAARADLLSVRSYQVTLDLTDGAVHGRGRWVHLRGLRR
jgi:hypothetical protein